MNNILLAACAKIYREKLGITQDQLSKMLGLSQSTIARWELGKYQQKIWVLPLEPMINKVKAEGIEIPSTVNNAVKAIGYLFLDNDG